jgi:hypothetical protein
MAAFGMGIHANFSNFPIAGASSGEKRSNETNIGTHMLANK